MIRFVHSDFTAECGYAFGRSGDDAVELGDAAQWSHERAVRRNVVVRVEPTFDRVFEQAKR